MTVTSKVEEELAEARLMGHAAMLLMNTGALREATLKASDASTHAARALVMARDVDVTPLNEVGVQFRPQRNWPRRTPKTKEFH